MSATEHNYSACERELLAVVFVLRKFQVYHLSKHPFVVVMDQQALKAAIAMNDMRGRIARCLDFLAEYELEFQYRKGCDNQAAD